MSTATELLRRALKFLDYRRIGSDTLEKDIKTFLAAEPEAEPVAWGQPDACGNIVETITPDDKTHTKAPKGWADIYSVPLYTRPEPAIRKPMTDEEIQKGVKRLKEMVGNKSSEVYAAFEVGIRVAEKYHEIGGGDE